METRFEFSREKTQSSSLQKQLSCRLPRKRYIKERGMYGKQHGNGRIPSAYKDTEE